MTNWAYSQWVGSGPATALTRAGLGCEAKGEAGPHSLGLAEAEEGVGLLARKQRGRGFFLFYFVFKTKFNL